MTIVKLLDCTLRDGGYVNDWEFGHDHIVNVFERLISAGIDIVEVGFLDQRRAMDMNRTIFPDTRTLDLVYAGLSKGSSIVVGMIDYGTCSIENIAPCSESFIDGIRVIFKKERMESAIAFCRQVKDLGYKVFAQAVSITSYSDEELSELLDMVNDLEPYAFSLVDTYGLLHKGDLMHYFEASDKRLKPDIGLGYHSHNNFQLAYSNCIELLEKPIKRMLLIDSSLYGMGKSAGNAPTELLAMYMNEHQGKKYAKSQLLEAIDVTVLDIFRRVPWGYSFKFFLAASNDCHPNYVSYLMDKKKLSVKSINEILSRIEKEKKLYYSQQYIENLYIEYQKKEYDDKEAYEALGRELSGKQILLLGPGSSVEEREQEIQDFIQRKKPLVIAINFMPAQYRLDYVFISNAKRYVQLATKLTGSIVPVIATSNVTRTNGKFDYTFCYSDLLDEKAMIVDNPMIMLMKLLDRLEAGSVMLAGFDGYSRSATQNYVNPNMEHTFSREKAQEINHDVRESLGRLKLKYTLTYLTPSFYGKGEC